MDARPIPSRLRSRLFGAAIAKPGEPRPRKTIAFIASSKSLPRWVSGPSPRFMMKSSPARCAGSFWRRTASSSGSTRFTTGKPEHCSMRCCATSRRKGHGSAPIPMSSSRWASRKCSTAPGLSDGAAIRTSTAPRWTSPRRFRHGSDRPGRVSSSRTAAMGDRGVWKVELGPEPGGAANSVRVLQAQRGSIPEEEMPLADFMARCAAYFSSDGCIVDQAFQPRLPEGMIRCYMGADRVVGFGHQLIKALITPPPEGPESLARNPARGSCTAPTRRRFRRSGRRWKPSGPRR
jgi:hypothetical protein